MVVVRGIRGVSPEEEKEGYGGQAQKDRPRQSCFLSRPCLCAARDQIWSCELTEWRQHAKLKILGRGAEYCPFKLTTWSSVARPPNVFDALLGRIAMQRIRCGLLLPS